MRTKLTGDVPILPDDVTLGREDTHGIGLDLWFETGKTTPKEIWENKDVWYNMTKASTEFWESLTPEQQEALIHLVTGALERMHDRVEDWVPEGLRVEGGEWLDINIKVLFTDIDKAIDRNEQATSFQIDEAAASTIAALEALTASEDEPAAD